MVCNLMTIFMDNVSGVVTLHNSVPAQDVRLKEVRIEFDSDVDAANVPIIGVHFPWLSHNQINDSRVATSIPISVVGSGYVLYQTDLCFTVSRIIPEVFEYKLFNFATGAELTTGNNLTSVLLIFEYEKGTNF